MGCLCSKEKPKSNEVRGISRKSFYEREIKVSFENGEDDLSKENPTAAAITDDVAKDKENFENSETGSQNSKCTEKAGNLEPQNDH